MQVLMLMIFEYNRVIKVLHLAGFLPTLHFVLACCYEISIKILGIQSGISGSDS